jgi:protein tyrosine phosphatase (PTP) superfamily phosphohydrolase (DUF442 family)
MEYGAATKRAAGAAEKNHSSAQAISGLTRAILFHCRSGIQSVEELFPLRELDEEISRLDLTDIGCDGVYIEEEELMRLHTQYLLQYIA